MTKYRTPVVFWESEWHYTGEIKKIKLDNGEIRHRRVKVLKYKRNPEYKHTPLVRCTK
jgi:hypothetical protein